MTAAPIGDGSTSGDDESLPADRSASRLLRLYPAAYRQVHGAEIAAIHAEAVADAGPVTRLREGIDVASHALRVRLHITSSHRAGQVLAAALPYVLAVLAANSAFRVGMYPVWGTIYGRALPVACAVMLLAVLCTVIGRWGAGRLLMLLGLGIMLISQIRMINSHNMAYNTLAPIGTLLTTLLLAAAPRDLPPIGRRDRTTIVKVGLALLVPQALAMVTESGYGTSQMWPSYVLLFIAAFMALSANRSAEQRYRAAGALLALISCMAFVAPRYWFDTTWSIFVIKLLGVMALSALVVFAARRGARLTRQ